MNISYVFRQTVKTQIRLLLTLGSTQFAILSTFFGHITLQYNHNVSIVYDNNINFLVSKLLGFLPQPLGSQREVREVGMAIHIYYANNFLFLCDSYNIKLAYVKKLLTHLISEGLGQPTHASLTMALAVCTHNTFVYELSTTKPTK